jgi:ATP-dependent helicase/nuclease subunit B
MPAPQANVFTIPASAPFLTVLIGALRSGKLIPGFPASNDPLELARATLYLPTRRACRLAREAFLEQMKGDAAILPRIVAIGDLDEDEIVFAQTATGDLAEAALTLPDDIKPLERRLLLAELILNWANSEAMRGADGAPLVANTPQAALGLADDLARLIDDMTTRQVGWDRLDGLAGQDLDEFWQKSLDFLKIAREFWPARLKELGVIEAAERRDKLIEAEQQRLASSTGPVIAAGSTGSMPATAKLLAAIATLPHGAVVLPGLDTDLDDASWALIAGSDDKTHDSFPAAGHAQFAMQALLTRIGIARDEVQALAAPTNHGRERLISEALRPASTTEHWLARRGAGDFDELADTALKSAAVIEAANAEEEALAIAVCLREAVETPDKTAALITPDRALARRVVAALERWNVAVDDSGGEALADTSAGIFARLAAEAAVKGLEPVTLLALLKHPLLRLGAPAGDHADAIATLERALLRGPRPKPGSDGLANALATFRANRDEMHRSDPRWLIEDDEYDVAAELIARVGAALTALERLGRRDYALSDLAKRHRDAIAELGKDAKGKIDAFANNDGVALARALEELVLSPSAASLKAGKGDYPELFQTAIGDRVVRRPEVRDVRVRIFGPLEARLQQIDRVVLGGLNEASWPPETRSDPWLSRPMRRELGLDPPERRIGLSAHDFAQALGAPEIILSRAAKVGGAPTVTSRFVQRIAALAGKERWHEVLARGTKYLDYARALDSPAEVKAAARPAPKPPIAARPSRLSVTAIEDWLRDPYTIYAKYILKLMPLDAVYTPPGARDRGTVIHGAIGDFTTRFARGLPDDPSEALLKLGEKRFEPLNDYQEARAFWWPRFLRITQWFVPWDTERRVDIKTLHAEIRGELKFPVGNREFTLSAVADRIEQRGDGSYVIIDYKTGSGRTEKQVRTGLAPQLTLEGAILRGGGFKDIAANGSVAELAYVTLKGGEPAGKHTAIAFKDGTPDTQADHALTELKALATTFDNADTPYLSLVHPMWTNHYGDYDHLARVKEWSLAGGSDEEGGE